MSKQYFPVYDFNKSSYINSRDTVMKESTMAVRKMSVWKKNFAAIEDNSDTRLLVNWSNWNELKYIRADVLDDILASSSRVMETPGTVDPDTDQTVYTFDSGELATAIDYLDMGSTTDIWASGRSIARIDILEFIKAYQVESQLGFVSREGIPLLIDDTIALIGRVKNLVSTKTGRVIYYRPNNKSGGGNAYEVAEDFMESIGLLVTSGSVRFTGFHEISAKNDFRVITHNGTEFVYEYKSGYMTYGDYDAHNRYTLSMVDCTDAEREVYTVLDRVIGFISDNVGVEIPQDTNIEFSLGAIIKAIEVYEQHVGVIKVIFDAGATAAKDTPLGKVLHQYKYVESLLQTDISGLNEMYLALKLQNWEGKNGLEDADEATNVDTFERMVDRVPKWKKYFYAVVAPHSTDWKIYGYVPNWDEIKKATPWVMAELLTACITFESGVPAAKTDWTSIVVIFIATVISIASAGTLTGPAYAVVVSLIALGGALGVAGVYYENEHFSKIGMAIGAAGGVVSLVATGIKLTASAVIQYALQISGMGLDYFYKGEMSKLEHENSQLSEEIDGIEEIVTEQEKEQHVKNFIYGENMDAQYTIKYGYDHLYKVKYM